MRKVLGLLLAAALPLVAFLSPYSQGAPRDTGTTSHLARESQLLEIGPPPKSPDLLQSRADLKIVSYNIRWRSGDDLEKLIRLFKDDPEIGGASILGLQEVDRNKKRSGNKNTAAILARELGMYYAWAAPPAAPNEKEEETGVSILSAYPLADVRRLVLPHKGPGGRRRVALGATVKLGQISMRVYSFHGETRLEIERKIDQMKAVIDDLVDYRPDISAIVLGDLNTWEPAAIDKTFKLFRAENFRTPFAEEGTFSDRVLFIPIELKLDWIWLRNLETTSHGIDREITISDHWPLWVVLRRPAPLPGAAATKH